MIRSSGDGLVSNSAASARVVRLVRYVDQHEQHPDGQWYPPRPLLCRGIDGAELCVVQPGERQQVSVAAW